MSCASVGTGDCPARRCCGAAAGRAVVDTMPRFSALDTMPLLTPPAGGSDPGGPADDHARAQACAAVRVVSRFGAAAVDLAAGQRMDVRFS
jgi:hypothetical protein